MTPPKRYSASIDYEANSEDFWHAWQNGALPEEITAQFEQSDEGIVTEAQRAAIEALPGFNDGPEYAPTALIFEPIQIDASQEATR